jgi:acetyltransferase-like isoleucine patch superfamily enzyme
MDSEYPKLVLHNIGSNNFVVFAERNTRILNTEIFGTIFFGFGSYINSGIIRSYVEVGRYCSIGRGVSIGLGNHEINNLSTSPFFKFPYNEDSLKLAKKEPKRRVIIGNDVWIGDGVMITSGVSIGNGAVIAAGAVVTKDVGDYEIVGGIPAKLIRTRFPKLTIDKLKRIKWWEYSPTFLTENIKDDLELTIENISKGSEIFPVNYERKAVK